MKDLLEISCGLDVHKEKIVACILTGPLGKPTRSEIREFSTLIPDMIALRNWIVSKNCHHVAMESTGIYWMPIYEILEDAFYGDITLLVVNARHMKNVPGKKTDMRDSEWISTLLRAGLLNGSFIPEKRIREFRDLNRYRKSVIRDITSQKNRIEKNKGCFYCHLIATYYHFWHKICKITVFLRDLLRPDAAKVTSGRSKRYVVT